MFRIAILYAGGTIGMRLSTQGLVPDSGFVGRLQAQAAEPLARLAETLGAEFRFEALSPLIDSAEAQPATWLALAAAVRAQARQADAVVLLHGTDTLSYTASALSFHLLGLGLPVVVSGAQRPFGVPESDAWGNLALALRAARGAQAHEVLVAFAAGVYRANRCTKVSAQALQAFDSPNAPSLARMDGSGELQWAEPAAREVTFAPLQEPTAAADVAPSPQLGVLPLHPGLDISRWRAWLHHYGSGNAPVTSTSLLDLLIEARACGTLVVNLSACLHGTVDSTYATAGPLVQAGVLPGRNLTLECAVAKLDWVCRRHTDVALRRDEFNQITCGEMG
jgi:L-asparaginase/Glu-tRNA(Gln) amidotransferase subunit D